MKVIGFLLSSLMHLCVADVRELATDRYTFRSCPRSFSTVSQFGSLQCKCCNNKIHVYAWSGNLLLLAILYKMCSVVVHTCIVHTVDGFSVPMLALRSH